VWLKAQLGLKPQCGCQQRQAAANAIGFRAFTYFQNLKRKLTGFWYNDSSGET